MKDYLHHIKTCAGSLAIQCSVSNLKLTKFATSNLLRNYYSFVTAYSILLGSHNYVDLQSKFNFF